MFEMFEELEEEFDMFCCGFFGDGKDDVQESDCFVVVIFQLLYVVFVGCGGEIFWSVEGIIIDECYVQFVEMFFQVI